MQATTSKKVGQDPTPLPLRTVAGAINRARSVEVWVGVTNTVRVTKKAAKALLDQMRKEGKKRVAVCDPWGSGDLYIG